MTQWKIIYYASANTASPVYEFIESLPEGAQSKVLQTFELLIEYNVLLRGPHIKKVVGTPLWELRILGTDSIRIFYISVEVSTFLLLHGFKKKQQKTPQQEIQTALKRLKEYRSRS